jgi:hypothetical protein
MLQTNIVEKIETHFKSNNHFTKFFRLWNNLENLVEPETLQKTIRPTRFAQIGYLFRETNRYYSPRNQVQIP